MPGAGDPRGPAVDRLDASDRGAGVDGATSGSVALDTAAIGTHSVSTPTVSDRVAHHVTASCDYSVIWDFNGFRAPLKTFPDFATVAAGQPVRVTFMLGGDQGLDVLAAAFPQSAGIDCSSTAALESGAPTSSSAPLSFSSGSDVYTYSWVTSNAWKGTCRPFILKLADGTFQLANVRFK
jgi:hypothetical protein